MPTATQMYWFTRLDHFFGLAEAFIMIGAIALFASVLIFVISANDSDGSGEMEPARKKWLKRILTSALVLLCLGGGIMTFVPTTKEMAAIYIVPEIVNSEKLRDAGDRMYTLAIEWMEELRPEKGKK